VQDAPLARIMQPNTALAVVGRRLYDARMLSLQAATPDRWLRQVEAGLDELLIDHAHCEKKAAGVAMNLIFAYVDHVELCRALADVVQEELDHFRLVLDLLARRGIAFRRVRPSRYGERLHGLVSKEEPGRAVDRLIVAGLIEARSCERFGLLRDHLQDRELAAFFGSLFESEARHHSTYVRLAGLFAPEEEVRQRLHELAAEEARIMAEGDVLPRMHS
jgi:tRNA-(ms[2]io[6]A)-hydroxylase